MTFNIAFVLYPGFEELDFAGPYEALAAAGKIVAHEWQTLVVAAEKTVLGTHGLSVNADFTFECAPDADMILVPGGQTVAAMTDSRLVEYVRTAGNNAKWVTSVCTGAFVLQRAGFLDGKRATTYWAAIEALRKFEEVEVVADQRWIHDGNVITAAGVSAGIDMALYMIGRLVSPKAARDIQQYMEYYPAPPYADSPLA